MNDHPELAAAADAALAYLRELPARRVAPDADALAAMDAYSPMLPDQGCAPEDAVRELAALAGPATVATAGPRFFGYVTGGAVPATVGANWLAAAWDQAAADYRLSPAAVRLEQVTGAWLLDLLRLPQDCAVNYVTGTTMASFVGLAAARSEICDRQGWDVAALGLAGAPPIRIVAGADAHPTLFKALSMLGLGSRSAILVDVDDQGRMLADALPELGPDTIVCVQAGNVNSGGFDPLEAICAKACAAGAWVHVNGAFGLVAAASPAHATQLAGHDLADSWAVDGHKWLNTPYDCGVAICRHPKALRRAFGYQAAYLEDDLRNPRHQIPELSRRARSFEMWAALRSLGREGVRDIVERNCAQARTMASGLQALGLRILNDVVLNQVIATTGSADRDRAIAADVTASGVAWFSTTNWRRNTAIRFSFSSWATRDEDIDLTLGAIAVALERTAETFA
ncbi:aspartate aminotransferase family protein [Sphingomonas panacisoli]|uniref:Aspartate aminotransferase family protein n=1 Tax=Sphingomonas panacisoli TaxID=1813879 RepID=A0A5B8LKE3_9SPHN|nr:pyridoxal-dependent decarboxylase [Sphingomonas panacisoli]QDZ08486.1 aspartate aminotransferase family protein [Sphingomonas panacisoli]